MKFAHRLAKTEVFSLCALIVAASVLACASAAQVAFAVDPLISPGASAGLVFAYTLIIGVLPVVVVGAPVYAIVGHLYHRVRWYIALCIGLAPGLLALAYEVHLGLWSIAGGIIVSLVTHAFWKASYSNSLKADRLRRRLGLDVKSSS